MGKLASPILIRTTDSQLVPIVNLLLLWNSSEIRIQKQASSVLLLTLELNHFQFMTLTEYECALFTLNDNCYFSPLGIEIEKHLPHYTLLERDGSHSSIPMDQFKCLTSMLHLINTTVSLTHQHVSEKLNVHVRMLPSEETCSRYFLFSSSEIEYLMWLFRLHQPYLHLTDFKEQVISFNFQVFSLQDKHYLGIKDIDPKKIKSGDLYTNLCARCLNRFSLNRFTYIESGYQIFPQITDSKWNSLFKNGYDHLVLHHKERPQIISIPNDLSQEYAMNHLPSFLEYVRKLG